MRYNFLLFLVAGLFLSFSISSCTKPEGSGEPEPLPIPEEVQIQLTEVSADITWTAVEGSGHYRCELLEGGVSVMDTTVISPGIFLDDLTPDTDYILNLRACPAEGSGEYTESEVFPITFTTLYSEFVIRFAGFYEGSDGFDYMKAEWIPGDKDMQYFPFVDQADYYDSSSSDEEYIENYMLTLDMTAQAMGLTLEQYLAPFLKTGDFVGSSVLPAPGRYYAVAFGCSSEGKATTGVYLLEIIYE